MHGLSLNVQSLYYFQVNSYAKFPIHFSEDCCESPEIVILEKAITPVKVSQKRQKSNFISIT